MERNCRLVPRTISGEPSRSSRAVSSNKRLAAGPFRIRGFQQNLGYIQIYPDISVGIFSPFNVRAKRKTLLESSPPAQAFRGKSDEHKCCCEQDAAAHRTVLYPNHYSEAPGWQRTVSAHNVVEKQLA